MNSKIIAGAIFAAGAMIAIAIIATQNSSLKPAFLDPHRDIKLAIEESLNDPSSVQYRNWKEGLIGYCVEVNAKNRFGAYAGFQKIAITKRHDAPGKYSISNDAITLPLLCKE